MLFTTITFMSTFNILWASCLAVPLMDFKNTLEPNVLDAMATSACSPNEECWEWLPIQDIRENAITMPKNLPIQRIPIRREASNIDQNTIIKSWNDNTPAEDGKIYPLPPATKQIGPRLSKKDVLMSRSWSAGGMPFSVLYMSPHGSRGSHSGAQQEVERATESSPPPVGHHNYRIALRNGGSSQPRRQYSIIPQLFISYGWGPFGK
ncbi:uncharacterized protein LOC143185750 [Calliopsis andreniformis]|uniref:uncharacterized protein LOC143185750 n=1 Tax=Calliopsis andreniformis TaxID=337506 RepID=UPI003FCD183F